MDRVRNEFRANSTFTEPALTLTDDDEESDIIILLESCAEKPGDYLRRLLRDPAITSRPYRAYTINYEPTPSGLLPGLYTGLNPAKFDPRVHRSWPHLELPNEFVYDFINARENPTRLFSFTGSCSHPIRRKLLTRFEGVHDNHKVVEIRRWYNHTVDEKLSYVRDLLSSRFILCPGGIAPYSHRIVESMALGRVPVIISDSWIPFTLVDAGEYYIRIREADINHVDRILAERADDFPGLSSNAKAIWNQYFSKGKRYTEAARAIVALHREVRGQTSQASLADRFGSRAFKKQNGWLLSQRVVRQLRMRTRPFRHALMRRIALH